MNFEKEITIHEKYEDPPFNTITKRKEKYLKKVSIRMVKKISWIIQIIHFR